MTSILEPEVTLGVLHDRANRYDEDQLPCRVNNPELWFAESPADVEFAKALCATCPVQPLCLASALDRREPWGVWGGQLPAGEGDPPQAAPWPAPQGRRLINTINNTPFQRRKATAMNTIVMTMGAGAR